MQVVGFNNSILGIINKFLNKEKKNLPSLSYIFVQGTKYQKVLVEDYKRNFVSERIFLWKRKEKSGT